MKKQKLFIAIVMIVISIQGFGQIKDIKINDEITVNKVYAGMLSGTMFSLDSLSSTNFVNVRIGSEVTYKPSKFISLHAWGIYQSDATNWYATSFWTKINPTKSWDIQVGKLATLATLHRPHPVTSGGQFETWAQAQSPGGALGVKTNYSFGQKTSIGIGVFQREKKPEYQVGLTISSFQIAGYYTEYSDQFCAVATLSLDRLYSTVAWKQGSDIENSVVATTTAYSFGTQKDIQVYTDQGYDLTAKKFVRSETGIIKLFSSQWIKGKLAMGYNWENNTVNGYLFVYL